MAMVAVFVLCATAWSQKVVSARAGLVHYVEGRVSVEGTRVRTKGTRFPQMKPGQTMESAQRARAEVLLNPTTFLRIGDSTSFRLDSDDLLDTRVELLQGTAVVDVRDLDNDNRVTVNIAGSAVQLRKDGVYYFTTAGGGRLRVYDGEAGLDPLKLTKGWELALAQQPREPAKFDRDDRDALYRWSEQRSEALDPPWPTRGIPRPPWVFTPLGR